MALLMIASIIILLCTSSSARLIKQTPNKINITENYAADIRVEFLEEDALNSTVYSHMNSSQDNFKYEISTFQYYRHKKNLLYKSMINSVTNKAYIIHNDICYYADMDSDEILLFFEIFLDLQGFAAIGLVIEYNMADEYKFIASHQRCPFLEIPCNEWHLNVEDIDKFGFKKNKFGFKKDNFDDDYDLIAYVTEEGRPVAFAPLYRNITECTDKDCILAIVFKHYSPGIQSQDKFLPPEPAKCKKSPV